MLESQISMKHSNFNQVNRAIPVTASRATPGRLSHVTAAAAAAGAWQCDAAWRHLNGARWLVELDSASTPPLIRHRHTVTIIKLRNSLDHSCMDHTW